MNLKTTEEIANYLKATYDVDLVSVNPAWITDKVEIDTDGNPPEDSFNCNGENVYALVDVDITSHNMPIHITIEGYKRTLLDLDGEIANQRMEAVLIRSVHLDPGVSNGKGVTVGLNGVFVTLKPKAQFAINDLVVIPGLFAEGVTAKVTSVSESEPFTYSLEVYVSEKIYKMIEVPESELLKI